ncbi:hypothetical protein DFH05DRAFT_1482003 [Lentinula detonsa]|uniref:Uncharacterized protein n=1 Tax=Lentinula detonsa TaxID=2804962 RepID=A0A9W8P6D7_9AGAR|nr:hypothetical protein DFH05DRAFT_1482003 [Lentinula detonsa]
MSVHFSLAKAASFHPWSSIPSTESGPSTGPSTGHDIHADNDPAPMNRLHSSPERFRTDSSGYLDRVPEDGAVEFDGMNEDEEENDEEEIDEELESQGLYRGSYRRLLILYTFVPLTSAVFFTLLALLPTWAYPLQVAPNFPSVLPFPLTELFVSAGLWCLSYMLRTPVYSLSLFICTSCRLSHYSYSTVLSTVVHAIISLLLRIIAVPILLIPRYLIYEIPTWHDPAFKRVWWVALGWAAVEAIVAIKQGFESITLYRDVLVSDTQEEERFIEIEDGATKLGRIYGATNQTTRSTEPSPASFAVGSSTGGFLSANTVPQSGLAAAPDAESSANLERAPLLQRESRGSNTALETSLELRVEEDVDHLIAVRARGELEKYYGIPFIRIPAFIPCLQRVNALLFSLGVTLILSSAYLQSAILYSLQSWYTHIRLDVHSADEHSAVYIIPSNSPSTIPSLETVISSAWPWSPVQLLQAPLRRSNQMLMIAVPVVFVVQIILSLLHSQLVLPKAGVHTVVYIGSLVSLGVFFAGLGAWDALS